MSAESPSGRCDCCHGSPNAALTASRFPQIDSNTTSGADASTWLENSIFKASHFAVDQSRRRRVKSLEQFISASRRSSCPKDSRNWSRDITDRHDTPPEGLCAVLSVIYIDAHRGASRLLAL